jgi:hypothetical protein
VASLNRPESNLTGVTFYGGSQLNTKQLELLRSALGRRGAEANDARTRVVGPRHSSYEAGEQSEGSPLRRRLRGELSGVGGAKGPTPGMEVRAQVAAQTQPTERTLSAPRFRLASALLDRNDRRVSHAHPRLVLCLLGGGWRPLSLLDEGDL